jgi:hypothetical protein
MAWKLPPLTSTIDPTGDGAEDNRMEIAMNLKGLRRPIVSAVLVVTCM